MRRAAVTLALIFAAQNANAQTTGYKISHGPRMALVLTGAGWIGLGFGLSVLSTALESFAGQTPWMVVPIAGPWVALGLNGGNACNLQTNDCSSKALFDFGLVGLGLTEAVGAVLLAIGLVPHDQKTAVHASPTFAWRDGPRLGLAVHF